MVCIGQAPLPCLALAARQTWCLLAILTLTATLLRRDGLHPSKSRPTLARRMLATHRVRSYTTDHMVHDPYISAGY
ncbi:unnamed protein product [Clonostachys solani]|uniref:Uncharacterized protein n=1 Tax=Clonostachys solani TaxID=160281 RepID=A0A9N9YZQ7_9HYPO|nr:unnamed protein product [Clonostachys solani]